MNEDLQEFFFLNTYIFFRCMSLTIQHLSIFFSIFKSAAFRSSTSIQNILIRHKTIVIAKFQYAKLITFKFIRIYWSLFLVTFVYIIFLSTKRLVLTGKHLFLDLYYLIQIVLLLLLTIFIEK